MCQLGWRYNGETLSFSWPYMIVSMIWNNQPLSVCLPRPPSPAPPSPPWCVPPPLPPCRTMGVQVKADFTLLEKKVLKSEFGTTVWFSTQSSTYCSSNGFIESVQCWKHWSSERSALWKSCFMEFSNFTALPTRFVFQRKNPQINFFVTISDESRLQEKGV